ncbi:MAG: ABC transporter permease [Vicinamibacterales bacterium]
MWDDIRVGLRTNLRSPGFAALAVITLALGIGANTAIFSVVSGVLLRPLPYPDPDRVVAVWTSTSSDSHDNHSAGDFIDIERDNQSFSAIAGYRQDLFALIGPDGPALQFQGAHVTVGFFDVFQVPPALGRTFTATSDRGRTDQAVVLSDAAWRQAFGGSPDAAGRTIRVNGQPHVVLGVMPPSFAWPEDADLWMLSPGPAPPPPIEGGLSDRDVRYFDAVARVKPGVTTAELDGNLARLGAAMDARRSATAQPRRIVAGPLYDQIVGPVRPAILILQAGVGLVLLIACANISSLLIARTTGRQRELAVRAALGAPAGRLVRQLLTESLVLGVVGGLLGLLAGRWLITLLLRLLPSTVPRTDAIALDVRVALVTLAVAGLASLLFGALPALQGARAEAASALRAARGSSRGRSTSRTALVVLEVALTLVLLTSAGLLGNSLLRLQAVDSGYRPDHVTLGSIAIPQSRYPTGESQVRFYQRLLDALDARGEVEEAGLGFPGPFRGQNASGTFYLENRPTTAGGERPHANLATISPGYLEAMGVDLVEGRGFAIGDTADAPGVAIVSRTLAERYWPGESAVGRRISFDSDPSQPWITIVGVASDVRQLGLREPPPALVYMPFTQFTLPFTNVAVRSTAPDAAVTEAIRTVLSQVDPELPLADIITLPALITRSMADARFRTFVFGVLALVALVLAAVGLYGLISFSVAQRRREIGIRVALGATPGQVMWPIVRWGAGLALAGAAVGLVGAWASARAIGSFLYGVSAGDPATIAGVAALLLAVAVLASWVPSRRATRVDPVTALRE